MNDKEMIEHLQSQQRLLYMNPEDRVPYISDLKGDNLNNSLSFDKKKKFQSVAKLQHENNNSISLPKIKEVKVSPKMALGKSYKKSFEQRNLNLQSVKELN